MTNLPSRLSEHYSSNEIDESLRREPKIEGQENCHDFDKTFTFPLDDTTSVIAVEAAVNTESSTLNILLANCNLVTFGSSSKANCYLDANEHKCASNGEVRSDSSLQQQKTTTEKSDCRLQPPHEAQS